MEYICKSETTSGVIRVIVPDLTTEEKKSRMKNFYDVCNRLFTEEDDVFYKLGECKKLGMKAI